MLSKTWQSFKHPNNSSILSKPDRAHICTINAATPSASVSQPRPSFGSVPSFRDVSRDAIHASFFPFSAGLYYATYHKGGVAGNCEFTHEEWDAPYRPTFEVLTKEVFKDHAVCKTMVDQFPTPREIVRVKSLFDDQLTTKMSVLYCMMMSHGGELFAHYRGLLRSHHEYVLLANSRLKGYEERVASFTGLELQVSALKRQVFGLNDKLSSSDASFAKSKAKGKERKKNIKSLTKSLDHLHAEDLVRKFFASDEFSQVQGELLSLAASDGFKRGLSMHRTKDEFVVVLKKMAHFVPGTQGRLAETSHLPKKLARLVNIPASKDARVSPPIVKESTMTPASKSLELPANVVPASSAITSEQNEEWVNAMVDGPDPEMIDGATHAKSRSAFMHGTSYVLDDVAEVTLVGLERVSSGPTDVFVAHSISKKGDGSLLSSAADKEATTNPSKV
ncbi:hypothetical protein Tco_0778628 [Tanacetum coccineum]